MSHEYCLPITIKLDSSNRMSALLAGLYLLPLIPLYLEFEVIYAFAITLVCLAMLKYEWHRQSALKPFSSIQIDKKDRWVLVNRQAKQEPIIFKNFMWCGVVVFLLFTLNGKRQRVMVFANQQQTAHFHKLKIYLQNI